MYMFSNQAFSHFHSPPPPKMSMTLYCVTNKRLPAAHADIFMPFNRLAAIRCNIFAHYKPSNTSQMTKPSKKMQSWWNVPKVDLRFVFNHWIYTSIVPRCTSDVTNRAQTSATNQQRIALKWPLDLSFRHIIRLEHFEMLLSVIGLT